MLFYQLKILGFKSRSIKIEYVLNKTHIVRHSLLEISRSKVKVTEVAFIFTFSINITLNFQLKNLKSFFGGLAH